MKTLQVILIALTSLSGCAKKGGNVPAITNNNMTMAKPDSLTYLALGDSYTIGEAVPQKLSYPYQLMDGLNAQSVHVQPPTIIATTGWTTDNLIDAISRSDIHAEKYDFVTLLIGVK